MLSDSRFSSSYFGPPEGILAGERRRQGDIGGWATPMSMAGPTDRPTSECTSTLNEFFFRNKAIYYFGDRDRRRR